MKRTIISVALTGLVAIGGHAIADDSAKAPADKAQLMKECMERQKASNSSMTQSAMETVCKNEVNKHKDGNDLATGPKPANPQN
jgi:hypothetical protein